MHHDIPLHHTITRCTCSQHHRKPDHITYSDMVPWPMAIAMAKDVWSYLHRAAAPDSLHTWACQATRHSDTVFPTHWSCKKCKLGNKTTDPHTYDHRCRLQRSVALPPGLPAPGPAALRPEEKKSGAGGITRTTRSRRADAVLDHSSPTPQPLESTGGPNQNISPTPHQA